MDKMAPRVDNIGHYRGKFAQVPISDQPAGPAPAAYFQLLRYLAMVVIAVGLGLTTVWVVLLGHVLITLIVLAT